MKLRAVAFSLIIVGLVMSAVVNAKAKPKSVLHNGMKITAPAIACCGDPCPPPPRVCPARRAL